MQISLLGKLLQRAGVQCDGALAIDLSMGRNLQNFRNSVEFFWRLLFTWKAFKFKHRLLILSLLTSVHWWYTFAKDDLIGLRTKEIVHPTPIQSKARSILCAWTQACQGQWWSLTLSCFMSLQVNFPGLIVSKRRSYLKITFHWKTFHTFNCLFSSSNSSFLVEIYFWVDCFHIKIWNYFTLCSGKTR